MVETRWLSHTLKHHYHDVSRGWLAVWLAFSLPLSLVVLASGKPEQLWLIWGQALIAIVGHILFVFKKDLVAKVLLLLLTLLTLTTFIGWLYGAYGFHDTDRFATSFNPLAPRERSIITQGFQTWTVPTETNLIWSFEGRLTEGNPGWDWRRNDTAVTLTRMRDSLGDYTRVQVPRAETEYYISRTFNFDAPVDGRIFMFRMLARSSAFEQTDAYIMATGGARFPLSFSPEWQVIERGWIAGGVSSNTIRVLLRDLNGLEFDVTGLRLFELIDGQWVDLDLGVGTGMRVRAESGNPRTILFRDVLPTYDWESYRLEIPSEMVAGQVKTLVQLGEGLTMRVRNSQMQVASPRPGQAEPLLDTRDVRQRLWFPDANLAAHSITAIGLVLLASTSSMIAALAGWVFMVAAVLLTGSRTALLVAVLGGLALLAVLFRRKKRMNQFVLILVIVATIVLATFARYGLFSLDLRALNLYQEINRLSIWQTAWEAFLEYPVSGLPNQDFERYFNQTHSLMSPPPVNHGHNFWLDFAARYGVAGLFSSLVLSGALVWFAWRRGRWQALILISAILALQILDTTLLFFVVLFSVIVGLNMYTDPESSSGQPVSRTE